MKHDPTADSGFYIHTKTIKSIPTDDDTEKPEDYIVEDPVRMTGRDMKKLFIIPTLNTAKEDSHSHVEMDKILAMMLNDRPTTAPLTSTGGQLQLNHEHNIFDNDYVDNEESSWVLEPTEKVTEKDTLPWLKDFDYKMWSNWNEREYNDHIPDEQIDTEDVYGRKRL
jgi:hypothetical protein